MSPITLHDLQDMQSYVQSWLNELQLTKLILTPIGDGYIAYGTTRTNANAKAKPAIQIVATRHPTHGIHIECHAGYMIEYPESQWHPVMETMHTSTGHHIPNKQTWVSEYRMCNSSQTLPIAPHPDTMIAIQEWVETNLNKNQQYV